MFRSHLHPLLPFAAILLVAAPPAAAQASEPVLLVNAFQVDVDGNVVEGFDLEIEGKALVVGDALYHGQVMTNRGRLATVMTVSTGDTLTLDASLSKLIALDSQERKCRCECLGATFSYPPTTEEACADLTGQKCENPPGTVGILRNCEMRWVKVTSMTLKALNASSAEIFVP